MPLEERIVVSSWDWNAAESWKQVIEIRLAMKILMNISSRDYVV